MLAPLNFSGDQEGARWHDKQVTMPGNTGGVLYGYLVTNGAYTPAESSVFKITLHAIGL